MLAINQRIKFKLIQNTIYIRVKIITDELHFNKYLYTMPVIMRKAKHIGNIISIFI